MKRLLVAAAWMFGGCVMDGDHHHRWRDCYGDAVVCEGDRIEACVDGEWVVLDDCWVVCEGTCAYDQHDEAACFCP